MSTCVDILAKLDAIDSRLENIKLGQEVVDKINSIDSNLTQFMTAFNDFETSLSNYLNQNFTALSDNQSTLGNLLSKVGDNQIHSAENLVNLSNGIKTIGTIVKANNDSIKSLSMSNGSLPSEILQQISNIEAVTNALNEVILK
ncbi:hypothetical protein CRV02_08350 [Arcobacter sp. CECT 8989]|uniref:hypothetical protein n=1 Tax=Arcobacter sp. CECT 8989 TaxID=2044509 RepID=UPI00100A6254|nr:hypothetical protein [Arcobacter sp. CECT 8989]RXK01510.1 hypothetical protein CRV02_08350 [Arcobacter sp. CECT 8989]